MSTGPPERCGLLKETRRDIDTKISADTRTIELEDIKDNLGSS
jgi:hypothetical protein